MIFLLRVIQVEDDENGAAASVSSCGRPKRSRRAAPPPTRGNKDLTKSESENLNEEETHSDEN